MSAATRRLQSDGRILCATCHVDRRWCTLPLLVGNDRRPWAWRAILSLILAWTYPSRYFRESPASQPIVAFIGLGLLVRVPLWMVTLALTLRQWHVQGLRVPFETPHLFDATLGSATADVLALWLHCMVPLGVPAVIAIVSFAAQVPVALTASSLQTFASTFRVAAIAVAGYGIVLGLVEVLRLLECISVTVQAVALGAMAIITWGFLAIALARTHRVSLLAGIGLALFPALVLAALSLLRPLLTWPGSAFT